MDRVRKTLDLTPEGAEIMEALAERLGLSQTGVVELALRELARRWPIEGERAGPYVFRRQAHDD